MSEDRLEMDFYEDDEVQEEPESQEEAEQVTEEVEETPETEPVKPHDPDKGLQKLQQEFGNFRRASEEREQRLQEALEALRRERETPEPKPEPTEVDRLLETSDDEVDPYKATKTLAAEVQALKRQLAEERQGREQLSGTFQQTQAQAQREAAERNFRQKYPDFDGDFNTVQTRAYEYLSNQYPDVRDWSQMPASVFSRHASEAVQHVVESLKPAEPKSAELSKTPPKSTAGTKINTGKPAKKEPVGMTVDQMIDDPGFFFDE